MERRSAFSRYERTDRDFLSLGSIGYGDPAEERAGDTPRYRLADLALQGIDISNLDPRYYPVEQSAPYHPWRGGAGVGSSSYSHYPRSSSTTYQNPSTVQMGNTPLFHRTALAAQGYDVSHAGSHYFPQEQEFAPLTEPEAEVEPESVQPIEHHIIPITKEKVEQIDRRLKAHDTLPSVLNQWTSEQLKNLMNRICGRMGYRTEWITRPEMISYFYRNGVKPETLAILLDFQRGVRQIGHNVVNEQNPGQPIHDLKFAFEENLYDGQRLNIEKRLAQKGIDIVQVLKEKDGEKCDLMTRSYYCDGERLYGERIKELYRYLAQRLHKTEQFLEAMDAHRKKDIKWTDAVWRDLYKNPRKKNVVNAMRNAIRAKEEGSSSDGATQGQVTYAAYSDPTRIGEFHSGVGQQDQQEYYQTHQQPEVREGFDQHYSPFHPQPWQQMPSSLPLIPSHHPSHAAGAWDFSQHVGIDPALLQTIWQQQQIEQPQEPQQSYEQPQEHPAQQQMFNLQLWANQDYSEQPEQQEQEQEQPQQQSRHLRNPTVTSKGPKSKRGNWWSGR